MFSAVKVKNPLSRLGGGSWILRDSNGKVLIHSHRAFVNCGSLDEVKLQSLIWSITSMQNLHKEKVIFATQDSDLLGAILRPRAWLSFKAQVSEILFELAKTRDWRLEIEVASSIRGVSLIAQSVTNLDHRQLYVVGVRKLLVWNGQANSRYPDPNPTQ